MAIFDPLSTGFKALTSKAKMMLAGFLLALLIGSNVATGFIFYNKGKNVSAVEIANYEKRRAEMQSEIDRLQGASNTKIVVKYVDRFNTITRIVEGNERIIYRDVSVRPDQINGVDNTLPMGSVYAHDQMAKGEAIDPALASDPRPSGIGDTVLLSTINTNYGQCHLTEANLEALQEWVRVTKANYDQARMKSQKKRGID